MAAPSKSPKRHPDTHFVAPLVLSAAEGHLAVTFRGSLGAPISRLASCGLSWEPPASAGGRSASALREEPSRLFSGRLQAGRLVVDSLINNDPPNTSAAPTSRSNKAPSPKVLSIVEGLNSRLP